MTRENGMNHLRNLIARDAARAIEKRNVIADARAIDPVAMQEADDEGLSYYRAVRIVMPHTVRVLRTAYRDALNSGWLEGKRHDMMAVFAALRSVVDTPVGAISSGPEPQAEVRFESADDALLFKLSFGGA